MIIAPLPANEAHRLASLRHYAILDTDRDPAFDALTTLTARLFKAPIAQVSLVGKDRQWSKSLYGLDSCELDRKQAFCSWVLLETDLFEVPDLLEDPRFKDSPLVAGEPYFRYYAGYPLQTPTGEVLGTLCILDSQPRTPLDPEQKAQFGYLAQAVMSELHHHSSQLHTELSLAAARDLEDLTRERLGAMAVRFRTPLTTVLGYSQLMQFMTAQDPGHSLNDSKIEKLSSYAVSIQNAGQALLELVGVTLETMRTPPASQEGDVDLCRLLDEVRRLAEPMADSHDMSLRMDVPGPATVHGEEVRIKQICLALISNALTHAGHGVITVSVRPREQTRQIILSISDQGPGMPEHVLAQLHSPRLRSANLGGLGLVKTLCHMQAFDLDIETTPEIGTMVSVKMPINADF